MEDDSKSQSLIKWLLGALGLGAVGTAVAVPHYGIWLGLAILVLALLIFGAYFLFRRFKARQQSRQFEGAIASQTAASPRAISDPNRRAALDKLRQKFQTGLQEFKSRGKDIYKLPWYVIIGEPGSGKSEAIRHSGIDFPSGLQDELQGSGGTVNMDWWFTNRSIILDTAGSMIFNEAQAGEAPEWREFLRLLKRARPNCPVNGLFLVLSVESLIKDSSDRIAEKASKLAQQLDLIQKTLDVRFPVYLLVTKCDLLTGFREFFDNIEDPLLQHQMFGWSNPEPLDAVFNPKLIEQHLNTVAERVRRRRLGLLRESVAAVRFGETQFFTSRSQPGVTVKRRLDEMDALYALPESVLRLAPRLQRYLERIFVAGEWSAKPVFLRGIYFTSSMREGKALDEAMALATGVSFEQLPEDRPWEKNRAFFMRDLFHEKVFREFGLVTRATNTLKLLRKRKLLIFGVASAALLMLLAFAVVSYRSLNRSVLAEASYWNTGSTNWNAGQWSPPIVRAGSGGDIYHFNYCGNDPVPGVGGLTVVQFQKRLLEITEKGLSVGWIFKPMQWLTSGKDMNRPEAQRWLFEGGVLKPLVSQTRAKMEHQNALSEDPKLVALHREALLSLIRLEADHLSGGGSLAGTNAAAAAARYIATFQSYLLDADQPADTNLVEVLQKTYAGGKGGRAAWPPASLLGGNSLAANLAVSNGLVVFRKANLSTQTRIGDEVKIVSDLADSLYQYQQTEADWQRSKTDLCAALQPDGPLRAAKANVDAAWHQLQATTNHVANASTNLSAHFGLLQTAAMDASASIFAGIANDIPESSKTTGLFVEILAQIQSFAKEDAGTVHRAYDSRSNWLAAVDRDQMAPVRPGQSAHEARWRLYESACALANERVAVDESMIGDKWEKMGQLKGESDTLRTNVAAYHGPLADTTADLCQRIAGDAEVKIKSQMVDSYAKLAAEALNRSFEQALSSVANAASTSNLLDRIGGDLKAAADKFTPLDLAKLQPVSQSLLKNAAGLRTKLGFPVLLNADPNAAVSLSTLGALRNLLAPVMAALSDPAWTGVLDGSLRASTPAAAQSLKAAADVISALSSPAGRPAKVELFFMPPKNDVSADIIRDFRQADAQLGGVDSSWQEVASHTGEDRFSLVQGTVDGNLKIAFRRLPSDPAPVTTEDQGSWALVRLIHSGQLERSDSGTEWTRKIKLEDKDQSVSGTVVFKFVTERPLPKPEDWPQE